MPRPRVRLSRPRPIRAPFPPVTRAWIPGALTIGNLLGGYAAILASAEQRYLIAALLIVAAAVFDALDGRVARLTKATTDLGMQLDSLCDAVSFAVAPSMLVFHMGIRELGRSGYAVCFLFAACGVLRLARFNTLPPDHRYFTGLPIPLAAASIILPVILTKGQPLGDRWVPYHAAFVALIAFLMVSRVRYRTFKDVEFRSKAYWLLPLWTAVLAGLVAEHEIVLTGLVVFYLVSPLVFAITDRVFAHGGRHERAVLPRREIHTEPAPLRRRDANDA